MLSTQGEFDLIDGPRKRAGHVPTVMTRHSRLAPDEASPIVPSAADRSVGSTRGPGRRADHQAR
jgi:hypothetical protein